MWIFGGEVKKVVSDMYQCKTCEKWFPNPEWLKIHNRMYLGDTTHEDKEKNSLVEWLEFHTGWWTNPTTKEDYFEVKEWIEKIDPNDSEYRKISLNFMQFGLDMKSLKDITFDREDINAIVTEHNSNLDGLYTSKIWEKIVALRQIATEGKDSVPDRLVGGIRDEPTTFPKRMGRDYQNTLG